MTKCCMLMGKFLPMCRKKNIGNRNCWGEMRAMEIIKLNAKQPIFWPFIFTECLRPDCERTGNYLLFYSDTHQTKELSWLHVLSQFSTDMFNLSLIFHINSPHGAIPVPGWLKPLFFFISFLHHGVFMDLLSQFFPRGHRLITHSVHPSVPIVMHDMLTISYPRYKHVRSFSWFPVWRCRFLCCALGEGGRRRAI